MSLRPRERTKLMAIVQRDSPPQYGEVATFFIFSFMYTGRTGPADFDARHASSDAVSPN
jgi:hypothetical protein